jgi:hypothetical protein
VPEEYKVGGVLFALFLDGRWAYYLFENKRREHREELADLKKSCQIRTVRFVKKSAHRRRSGKELSARLARVFAS